MKNYFTRLLAFACMLFPIFASAQYLHTDSDVDQLPRFTECPDESVPADQHGKCAEAALLFHLEDSLWTNQHFQAEESPFEVQFTIDEQGMVQDPVVLLAADEEMEAGLLRVFQQMPVWLPAVKDGQAVPVQLTLKANAPVVTNPGIEQFFVLPEFKGCEDIADPEERKACATREMLVHIYSNITYPAIARENGIEGTVVIRFVVEKDGRISNAEIVREIGGGCGAESLRVVQAMPDWNPGTRFNEPLRVQFNLPVRFKLEGAKKKKKRNRGRG